VDAALHLQVLLAVETTASLAIPQKNSIQRAARGLFRSPPRTTWPVGGCSPLRVGTHFDHLKSDRGAFPAGIPPATGKAAQFPGTVFQGTKQLALGAEEPPGSCVGAWWVGLG